MGLARIDAHGGGPEVRVLARPRAPQYEIVPRPRSLEPNLEVYPGPIRAFFRLLRERKSHNVAVTAVARKLVTIADLVLKNNEPYRYAKPGTVRAKFNEVRCKAAEPAPKRKKQDSADGPQLTVGRLNATYLRSSLPAAKRPEPWPADEHRALASAGVMGFARDVHTEPVKRPRARPTTKTKTKS